MLVWRNAFSLTFITIQVEVYQASLSGLQLLVVPMHFHDSFEEQRFLTSVQREKRAFETLIASKGSMVLPLEQDGASGLRQQVERDTSLVRERAMTSNLSTRAAGGAGFAVATAAVPDAMVVVDMRDLRSTLPVMLHEAGFAVRPLTLLVGDYILSPKLYYFCRIHSKPERSC